MISRLLGLVAPTYGTVDRGETYRLYRSLLVPGTVPWDLVYRIQRNLRASAIKNHPPDFKTSTESIGSFASIINNPSFDAITCLLNLGNEPDSNVST